MWKLTTFAAALLVTASALTLVHAEGDDSDVPPEPSILECSSSWAGVVAANWQGSGTSPKDDPGGALTEAYEEMQDMMMLWISDFIACEWCPAPGECVLELEYDEDDVKFDGPTFNPATNTWSATATIMGTYSAGCTWCPIL